MVHIRQPRLQRHESKIFCGQFPDQVSHLENLNLVLRKKEIQLQIQKIKMIPLMSN